MRKSAKLCLYAVVLAGVVGGTAAWATTDKAIAVTIDGQSKTIHTRSDTVAGALRGAHITVDQHDVVAPAIASPIHDHSKIVILKGRQLRLNVDGRSLDVWTTATTVDEALSDLGYGSEQTLSVSRSARLPLTATEITLLTPKTVTVRYDGKSKTILTTVRTVRQAILAAGVALGPIDRVSAAPLGTVLDNEIVTISRVRVTTKAQLQAIPYGTTSTDDPTTATGTTTVVTAGATGTRRAVIQFVYVDGKLAGERTVSTSVVSAPTTQVQKVGTKAVPATPPTTATTTTATPSAGSTSTSSAPAPTGSPQTIARAMLLARGWGSDQFSCLVSLWNRESGWNTHAANSSGAYGIPQALPGSKMSSAGPDWQNNATTQISWGLGYISARYSTPCGAWAHSQSSGWY